MERKLVIKAPFRFIDTYLKHHGRDEYSYFISDMFDGGDMARKVQNLWIYGNIYGIKVKS
jgi:hypothetical protein